MKNFILSFIAFLFVASVSAQVYVGDGFIYSKGTDLYAKGKINLTTNGKIYLRGEAQLIQGDDTPNEGPGVLSVFQEGTATNYDYNYWSAPVGEPTATGNQGFLNSQIHFPTLQAGFTETGFDNTAVEADLRTNYVINSQQSTILNTSIRDGITDDQTSSGVVQPLRIAGRWLYSYRNGGGYSGWAAFNGATTSLDAGYGFSMKGTTGAGPNKFTGGQRYDFRGRPNNGNITVTVETDDNTLVGNPYPSALDLKQFLIDANYDRTAPAGDELANSEIDNAVLFWEQYSTSHQLTDYEGGYGTYVPGGVTNATLDANGKYTGVDNGMYSYPTYTRFDSAGNITSGNVASGPVSPSGATVSRRYAAIGQGFMISRAESIDDVSTPSVTEPTFALGTSGTALFTNRQRAFYKEDADSYFKAAPGSGNNNPLSGNPIYIRPKLKLNIKVNDTYVRQLLLAFGDDSTDNLDWGLEGKINANRQDTDVYMPQFGNEYVIKTIPFAVTKTVDLGVDIAANNTTLEFHVGGFENFDTQNVLIHDKYNNTYHDVKNGSFTTILNAGQIDDRFEIVFENPTTLSNDSVSTDDQFDIVQNNNRQLLTVHNPNGLEVSDITLYDLAGKQVIASKEGTSNSAYTFETGNISSGIYIVRVLTSNQQEVAVKVSINN
ncbi:MAG: T9SS type A sorting domain-containing protein [Nonlabens sp.]|uniref:T9SS type A sorting domain-containing protein n=1 Tax=Nonlabens sp. TaxID=1888209 RepID=UPI003EF136C5